MNNLKTRNLGKIKSVLLIFYFQGSRIFVIFLAMYLKTNSVSWFSVKANTYCIAHGKLKVINKGLYPSRQILVSERPEDIPFQRFQDVP